MANINVDIFTDENDGVGVGNGTSLREAIIEANTNGDVQNTIVLPSGTYDLTIEGGSEDAGATGDLDILDDGSGKTLTITGAGADTTIIDAGEIDRVFHVLTGATLNISDVTVTGGVTPSLDPFTGGLGGGFLVEGTLNGSNLVIDDNQAANGGGIFVNVDTNTGVAGVVNLNDSTVSNNTVSFDGGGISSLFGGQFTADNIVVSGNTAARNAGGIGVAFQGSAIVSNSTITNNQTLGTVDTSPLPVGVGAGIHINDGFGTFTNSVIDGNTAATFGGGVAIGGGDPTGQGNPAPVDTIITDTTITNNTAAISSGSIALITDPGTAEFSNLSLAGNSPEGRFVFIDSFTFDDTDGVSDTVTPERGLQGDGIIFSPDSETLFVVRTDDPDGPTGPEPRLQSVLEFNTDGTYIDEFNFDIAGVPVGGTSLPNGNLLIAAVNPVGGGVFDGQIIEVATDGTIPDGGITIDLPDAFNDRAQRGLVVGVAYADKGTDDTADDSLLVVTSRSQEIVEFDLAGNELSSADLSQYGVSAPQGLAIDPATGNIFVADEAEDSGGTDTIYEITPISEDLVLSGEPRLGNLVSIIDTNAEFGIDDPEGLSISPDGTVYVVFDGDDPGVAGNQVATFALNNNPGGIPTLGTVDKYNFAGTETSFALTDFTEKLVDIEPFAGPAFVDPQGDDLASITIVGLPVNGTLSLSGADVLIGDEIAADAIDELVYASDASFGGVDTFLVTASDGTTDSLPANVDVFVSAPQSIQLTLENTYDFESADGLTFNPTTGTLFAAESLRQDAADPNTTTWVLREVDADTGALISTVVESEDNLEGDSVPDLDITPGIPSEGIQGIAVVQGTGTDRDGNILLLSTRGQAVVEVDPDTGAQVTAAEGGFEFVSDVIFSFDPPSSITGIYHALDDAGNEVLYAADFRGRQIIQFAKDGSVNDDAAIDLFQTIPEAELQGIVIDPATGNFLVADDATGNSSSIYEISPDGDLVGVTNLLELGGDDRFADTEGLGIDPVTRELYVAIDDDLRNPNFNIDTIGDQVAVFSLSDAPTPIGAVNGLPGAFNFSEENSSLVVNVVNYSGSAVQEVGVFFLDADGTIGGVAPTSADFASAALGRTQVVKSLIANSPTGFSQGNLQRILSNFSAGTQIAFVRVNDGTINEAINGQATDVTFSTDDDASITTTPTTNGFVLDFGDELSVQVASRQTSDLNVPPGVGLQNNNRLAAIDLRTVTTASNFTVTLTREAAFDNDVYFYAADDETGAVGGVAPNTDGSYLDAALGALIPGLDPFEVANGETVTGSGSLPAGTVLVPLIIVNGTLADLQDADTTNDPNVFFPFLGANSDSAEHVRILGDNTFGFEDVVGGDNDFQDITVSIVFN